jgi:hypothetical protein
MAALQSIPVPNSHSAADYLLLHFGVLGVCRHAPYKFKKSYGDGFVWRLPIVSKLINKLTGAEKQFKKPPDEHKLRHHEPFDDENAHY